LRKLDNKDIVNPYCVALFFYKSWFYEFRRSHEAIIVYIVAKQPVCSVAQGNITW